MPKVDLEKLYDRHKNWRSYRAIDEIEVYCDLLDHLQDKIDALETRCESEEATLLNVQAVISSYAIEIAMKSLWALDHPGECVPHTHDLVKIFDALEQETVTSLAGLELTRQELEEMPKPFYSNRYSMENGERKISVYPAPFLRNVTRLLRDKLKESDKALFKSLLTSTD